MPRSTLRIATTAVALALAAALGGCNTLREHHNAASVVDYLYPDKDQPVVAPGTPVLNLPLRVGIAFVPGTAHPAGARPERRRKQALLQQVADHFRQAPYVKSIEVIRSAYLRVHGSFANLGELRTMYGVDVVALVSYDQVQFTDEGLLSLTYWTIVGAYVVPGEKNDTQTMLDTVVMDIRSRKMLFRAPGTDRITGRSTFVNVSEQLRQDSETSFDNASKQMIGNLEQQLAVFRDKVKEHPEEFQVVRSAEYAQRTGGGSLDDAALALAALVAAAAGGAGGADGGARRRPPPARLHLAAGRHRRAFVRSCASRKQQRKPHGEFSSTRRS